VDSRKAEKSYRACKETRQGLLWVLGAKWFEAMLKAATEFEEA
jgi:hypothetical protein